MKNEPVLELKNLSIVYETLTDSVVAVKDVNLTVGRKQALGIIGESGCGKSTLAYAIMDYLPTNGTSSGEILFIDAGEIGFMRDRTHREFADEDIAKIADTYHNWRTKNGEYEDIKGFCKSAKPEEIKKHNYVLTPGRYVGIKEEEDDGIPFEEKMKHLTNELAAQFEEESKLNKAIKKNLEGLGYSA